MGREDGGSLLPRWTPQHQSPSPCPMDPTGQGAGGSLENPPGPLDPLRPGGSPRAAEVSGWPRSPSPQLPGMRWPRRHSQSCSLACCCDRKPGPRLHGRRGVWPPGWPALSGLRGGVPSESRAWGQEGAALCRPQDPSPRVAAGWGAPPQQREAGSLLVPHSPCSSTVLKASASNSSWVDTMAEFLRLVPSTWYPNTHKDGNRSPRV